MNSEAQKYLATEIISEQKTISYRNVARALKVHVNAAKCLLYEFHEIENKRKKGSIYATYLLAGVKKEEHPTVVVNGQLNGHHADPEQDHVLPSSPPPFPSSMIDPSQEDTKTEADDVFRVPVRTITLAREEDLEAVKSQYEKITSIHIYSLSATKLQDLVTLTDISRSLFSDHFVKEDPLTNNKIYGIIQNPDVRRRKGKRPAIPETAPAKFAAVKPEHKPIVSEKAAAASTNNTTTAKRDEPASSRESTPSVKSKPASLKRDASDLFKAFAKAKTKPKLDRQDTEASTNASASGAEDTKMTDADDEEGESEDEALFLDTGTRKPSATKKRASDVQKDRQDKAAKLRKLVESDDEDESAVPNIEQASGTNDLPPAAMDGDNKKPSHTGVAASTKDEDAEEGAADWSDSEAENPKPSTTTKAEPDASSQLSKRKRGKRKVTKKRTTKDEDGYLVTKEETVWESFSEADDEPSKPVAKGTGLGLGSGQKGGSKNTAAAQSQKSSGTGAGVGGGASQAAGAGAKPKKKGDIMSFFGKKNNASK